MSIEQLKSTFSGFSERDLAYLNGYLMGTPFDAPLKYEMVQFPIGVLTGPMKSYDVLDQFAQDVNKLSKSDAKKLVEGIWKDDRLLAKMGTPGKPTRIVRTT